MFVEVTVLRDQGRLRFNQQNYQVEMTENREVGQEVVRVQTQPNVSVVFACVYLFAIEISTIYM